MPFVLNSRLGPIKSSLYSMALIKTVLVSVFDLYMVCLTYIPVVVITYDFSVL